MEEISSAFIARSANITGRDCSQVCHLSIAATTSLAKAKRDERKSRISTRFARKSTFLQKMFRGRPTPLSSGSKSLREHGPGQGDPLFPWLEHSCDLEQMKWFLEQEVSGEAGFDDLVALTQVKMPPCAKLEMARNYWDEMGRGSAKGMHGPMLENLARHLELKSNPRRVVPEAVALGNAMIALAQNRCFAFHSVGALGAIEMTAPTRAGHVARGLKRLGVPAAKLHYFALHAVLDVKHATAWNCEVLHTLVAEDPRRAHPIAEGALIRLWHGLRCFIRYRSEFNFDRDNPAGARRQLCASLA